MDGLWKSGDPNRIESFDQANFNRFKLLRVNTDAPGADDASGFAAQNPTTVPLNVNVNGAPHFLMSPETGDGRPTLGFQVGLVDIGAGSAVAAAGGFTLTTWVLVEVAMQQTIAKKWLSFDDTTGVAYNELYSSFDINTSAIRFQISNIDTHGSVVICMAEL